MNNSIINLTFKELLSNDDIPYININRVKTIMTDSDRLKIINNILNLNNFLTIKPQVKLLLDVNDNKILSDLEKLEKLREIYKQNNNAYINISDLQNTQLCESPSTMLDLYNYLPYYY